MHFSLVPPSRFAGVPDEAWADIVLPLSFAFRRLGYAVEIAPETPSPGSRHIYFGSALRPGAPGLSAVPPGSVFVNMEDLTADRRAGGDLSLLERFTVWDYDRRNLERLAAMGVVAAHLEFGYVPEMTRLSPQAAAGDVLWLAAPVAARPPWVDELRQAGFRVEVRPDGIAGRERDAAMAANRLCLLAGGRLPPLLEFMRLGYLLANRKAVVAEPDRFGALRPELERAYARHSGGDLVAVARSLLADEAGRTALAEEGFAAFSGLAMEKSLAALVGRRTVFGQGHRFSEPRPRRLNIGSGRDFRNDALNVDINPLCNPDLALDLSRPLAPGATYATARFGEIELTPGGFDTITAFEVLEHVSDLRQTMTNFLDLLADGGKLILSVPYDLSLGAWQDPTHVRAFNENSWMYYTDWGWYLGWREQTFDLERLSFAPSKIGRKMLAGGHNREIILRTPRAVQGMVAVLRKRETTPDEKEYFDRMFRRPHDRPESNWELRDGARQDAQLAEYVALEKPPARERLGLLAATLRYRFYKHIGFLWAGREKVADLRAAVRSRRKKLGL